MAVFDYLKGEPEWQKIKPTHVFVSEPYVYIIDEDGKIWRKAINGGVDVGRETSRSGKLNSSFTCAGGGCACWTILFYNLLWYNPVFAMTFSPAPVTVPNFPNKSSFAFEDIDSSDFLKNMGCFSPVSEIVADLQTMVAQGPDSLRANVWQPCRVLRAVINSSIYGEDRIELVNDATTFALGMYAGQPDGDLLNKIDYRLDRQNILGRFLVQREDERTADSTTPTLSLDSAWRLRAKTDKPLLVIPLCHGGFLAGTQMLLYHQQNNPEAETFVYPVRHSRDKHGDRVPHISHPELKYLREIADGRTVVVFDEDAAGGDSVLETTRYLHHKLAKTEILGMVNLDYRTPKSISKQGEWWENHTALTPRFLLSLAAAPIKQLHSSEPLFL